MAWRVWSKLCCGHKWLLLLSPVFLLFLTIFVMTITLPLPVPPAERRSSRALSSAVESRSRPGVADLSPAAAFQEPLTHIQRRASSGRRETSKHSVATKASGETAGSDRNGIKERGHTDSHKNKHKGKGIASKRREKAGAVQNPTLHQSPNLSEFTVNNSEPKHSIKAQNRRVLVKPPVHIHPERRTSTATATSRSVGPVPERPAGRWRDRKSNRSPNSRGVNLSEDQQALGKHRQNPASKEQQAVKKLPRDLPKHHLSEDPLEAQKTLSRPAVAMKKNDSGWCLRFIAQDFPDSDLRRIRISPDHRFPPWLSEDDIYKMKLLAEGQVLSKAKVPGHGQVLQVALDPPADQQMGSRNHRPGRTEPQAHGQSCQRGLCSLIKRTDDWFEVFAFHLDRVLGLNRSLPAVFRTFHSDILPYRYLRGAPRPVVWWDPDIQHLADRDNDQNSVPLSWLQYQKLLQSHCGSGSDLRSAPCVGIQHSEWGRLALFDFLLQVNDRLDRYCCGFTPDPAELCVENLLHTKCGSSKDLLLVHILVRKAEPSRLVFIDNAGRPQQSNNNLNFRLVEGVDQFPERAVSVLQSGCLETLLLRSLYTDKEFWESQGGAGGLRPLIHTVENRGKILLRYIRDKNLQLKRDL